MDTTTQDQTRRKISIDGGFSIDEDDYRVVREMLLSLGVLDDDIESQVPEVVKLQKNKERRVCTIRLPGNEFEDELPFPAKNIPSLPASIGRLDCLTDLDIMASKITSIPSSIGQLQNLKGLFLPPTIVEFPKEMWNLGGLQTLYLGGTKSEVPEEIGNLTNLKVLILWESKITSLPSTIGRLQNLEGLFLSRTEKLHELPEEIGDLTSLELLDMRFSSVRSLPASIGRLQKLLSLDLSGSTDLEKLPHEIGNLRNLETLNLRYSGITSLPESLGSLMDLRGLYLRGAEIPELEGKDAERYLVTLVQRCPSLGCLGIRIEKGRTDLGYALACNRAMFRKESMRSMSKLWPLLLANATRAFGRYRGRKWRVGYDATGYRIQKPDAIFQLLVMNRETFIGLLLNRKKKNAHAVTKDT